MVGIEDKFGKSGKPDQLFEAYGLTAANVAAKAKELLK
jgi:transketolase